MTSPVISTNMPQASDVCTRPVLRYYGGKWRIARWILSMFPTHRCYVEPYGGAASVLMRKQRSYCEVYNDIDGEVVNLFRVLRDVSTADELERRVRLTPFSRVEFEESFASTGDCIEQARRTLVKSFMGIGCDNHKTGFRVGIKRRGTTAETDWKNFAGAMEAFCSRLQGVIIESKDALEIIEQYDSEETLFYVDPPYPLKVRNSGRGYKHEMTARQHVDLANRLREVRGMVVISSYPSDLYDGNMFAGLYDGWKRMERAAVADRGQKRTEVCYVNARAEEAKA